MNAPDDLGARMVLLEANAKACRESVCKDLAEMRALCGTITSEIHTIKTWLLGNGSEGIFESVRSVQSALDRFEGLVKAADEQRTRLKVAVITSVLSLIGVLGLATVQLVVGLFGG